MQPGAAQPGAEKRKPIMDSGAATNTCPLAHGRAAPQREKEKELIGAFGQEATYYGEKVVNTVAKANPIERRELQQDRFDAPKLGVWIQPWCVISKLKKNLLVPIHTLSNEPNCSSG